MGWNCGVELWGGTVGGGTVDGTVGRNCGVELWGRTV